MPKIRKYIIRNVLSVLLFPQLYLEDISLNIDTWSENFEWKQDPADGYLDYLQEIDKTVEEQEGDCEDYAFVVLSAKDNAELGLCYEWPNPWPSHVVAYDGERVYDSGKIWEKSFKEYIDDEKYTHGTIKEV